MATRGCFLRFIASLLAVLVLAAAVTTSPAVAEESWRPGDPYGVVEAQSSGYGFIDFPTPERWSYDGEPNAWTRWTFQVSCPVSDSESWMETIWTDTPTWTDHTTAVTDGGGTYYPCFGSGYWYPTVEVVRPPDGTHLYLTALRFGGTACGEWFRDFCLTWNAGDDTYEGPAQEPLTVEGLTDTQIGILADLLAGTGLTIDGSTASIDQSDMAQATATICTATETEIFKGGSSHGAAIGTLNSTQIGLLGLCQTLVTVALASGIQLAAGDYDNVTGVTPPPRGQPSGPDWSSPAETDTVRSGRTGQRMSSLPLVWGEVVQGGVAPGVVVPADVAVDLELGDRP